MNMNDTLADVQLSEGGSSVTTTNNENDDNFASKMFLTTESDELKLDFDLNDIPAYMFSASYCSEKDLISSSHSDPNQLFISHFNIRSLNQHFDQFLLFIDELRFTHGVIGLSETWLQEKSPSSLFHIDQFKLITNNRLCKKGGGVGFYVTENLNHRLLEEFSFMTEFFESIFIEIKVPNKGNVIVGEIYRPPNSNLTEFVELLDGILLNQYFRNKTCFLMGDSNLNLLNYDNHNCQEFLNQMLSKSFIPLIRKPTRITDISSTLIDNIFVNHSRNISPDKTYEEYIRGKTGIGYKNQKS